MDETRSIDIEQVFNAPPARVYAAFTNPIYLRQWLCDYAVIDGNMMASGTAYLFTWRNGYSSSGEFTAREPGRRVAFTSVSPHDPGLSAIEVTFAPDGEHHTRARLRYTHTPPDANVSQLEQGWRQGFERLAYFLETGLKLADMQDAGGVLPQRYASPADLAEALRRERAHLALDLTALLAGVSEQQAAYRPSPDEWNAHEVLAHLIFTERYLQLSLYGLMGGNDAFAWPDNNPAQFSPILSACPTVAALSAELKRAWEGSVGQVAALPPETAADLMLFTQVVDNWSWGGEHAREHFAQMRAAFAAARPT